MMSQSFKDRLFPILPSVARHFGTPFHIYDEAGIRQTATAVKSTFCMPAGFQEFFAVKALPNPAILELMEEYDFGFDCSSIAELVQARNAGVGGDRIMFTSNNTSRAEFDAALDPAAGGCILNLDDLTLIDKVPGKFPELICFRYNPGNLRTGNSIIGKPEEAKYGVAHGQIVKAYRLAIKKGAKRFGLHTMICSNELNYEYMVVTVKMLLGLIDMISAELGIQFEFINMGGGIGIPYRPGQAPVDIGRMALHIESAIGAFKIRNGYAPMLFMESGRYMTGPHGALVTTVINQKHIYREHRGLDACMSSLMRPGMYYREDGSGSYHHVDVLNPDGSTKTGPEEVVDVVGSLCEGNDKFAVQRLLPKMVEDDFAVIHDTGAHGIAMCFQYNGRPRPKELMLYSDGSVRLVGRAETLDDLFARYRFEDDIFKP